MMTRWKIVPLLLGLPLLLPGCISFGPEAPESLLTLTPIALAPAGGGVQGTADTAIAVREFEAPARIDVTRVPVQMDDSRLAYLVDATWVERPTRLFARLVAETIRSRGNRVVIDGDDPGVAPMAQLQGVLREFGYDARTSSVVVVVDAIRTGEGSAVTTRRFEARIPSVEAEGVAVGDALNRAANDVAGQIAAWVG